jgi:hypothetical protein
MLARHSENPAPPAGSCCPNRGAPGGATAIGPGGRRSVVATLSGSLGQPPSVPVAPTHAEAANLSGYRRSPARVPGCVIQWHIELGRTLRSSPCRYDAVIAPARQKNDEAANRLAESWDQLDTTTHDFALQSFDQYGDRARLDTALKAAHK